MKRLAVLLIALGGIAAALTVSATADDSQTVNATVTPKMIAVSVSTTNLQYGTLALNETRKQPTPAFFTATNTGSVPVDLQIRGLNTTAWQLAAAAGPDAYVHRSSTNPDPFISTALTENYQDVANVVMPAEGSTPAGAIQVYLNMDMPTATTSFATQTASVQILAVEP